MKQPLTGKEEQFLRKYCQNLGTQSAEGLAGSGTHIVQTLPKFEKIRKSVAMLVWHDFTEQPPKRFTATMFLMKLRRNGKVLIVSAGHNFKMIQNNKVMEDGLNAFTIQFGNESGEIPPLVDSQKTLMDCVGTKTFNLGSFARHFKITGATGSRELIIEEAIDKVGQRVVFRDGKLFNKSWKKITNTLEKLEDFFVGELNHSDVEGELKRLGLEYLPCGEGQYLDNLRGGLVSSFGYPGEQAEEEGKRPLRFTFGYELSLVDSDGKKQLNCSTLIQHNNENPKIGGWNVPKSSHLGQDQMKNFIIYDNDTFKGCSGSPVIGRARGQGKEEQGYCVKAIHVREFEPCNGGQKLITNDNCGQGFNKRLEKWINLGRNYINF